MNRFRFTKVRDVEAPKRGNQYDAGLDFYTPRDLTFQDLEKANKDVLDVTLYREGIHSYVGNVRVLTNQKDLVDSVILGPHSRIIIPSGIRSLIEPEASAFIAANKSGVSTKKGLVYSAQVVDSPYTGEIHLCVINTTSDTQEIVFGQKLTQFLHLPVYITEPEEITSEEYEELASTWGTRGSGWQGSTDKKTNKKK